MNKVVHFLSSHPDGLTDAMLTSHFGLQTMQGVVLPILNQLMQSNRLKSVQLETGGILFQLVEEQTAAKLQGLSPETMMVYHEIEGGGADGISTGDIKKRTNIQQNTLTKATKELERRLIIKRVKSIHQKTQKIWMLYELIPSTHITGGPWYTDNEFDHEFVSEISYVVENYIHDVWYTQSEPTSLKRVVKWVATSGVSQEALSLEHITQILGRLVFDSKIEEIKLPPANANTHPDDGPYYRSTMPLATVMEAIGVERSVVSPCLNYLAVWAEESEVGESGAVGFMDMPNPFRV
jgi:DNA-directed RNA polymerase III subunit RPC6